MTVAPCGSRCCIIVGYAKQPMSNVPTARLTMKVFIGNGWMRMCLLRVLNMTTQSLRGCRDYSSHTPN